MHRIRTLEMLQKDVYLTLVHYSRFYYIKRMRLTSLSLFLRYFPPTLMVDDRIHGGRIIFELQAID